MTRYAALASVIALTLAPAARAQTAAPPASVPAPIEPDRPDVTNGAHIVGAGLVQFEVGGVLTRVGAGQHAFGSPITARIGIAKWLEARIGGDGIQSLSERDSRTTGFGNVQLGAKVRLLGDENGVPLVSVLPAVNLPTASADKGLGSGDADYTALLLTGVDLGPRAHLDVNYGIGAIGAGGLAPHFAQHLVSASANVTIEKWSPYVEVYSLSKMRPDGGAVAAVDTGAIYTVNPRVAIDGGVLFGISRDAPDFAAFAGVSFAIGGGVRPAAATSVFRRARDRD